jgi:hypothetical protein
MFSAAMVLVGLTRGSLSNDVYCSGSIFSVTSISPESKPSMHVVESAVHGRRIMLQDWGTPEMVFICRENRRVALWLL